MLKYTQNEIPTTSTIFYSSIYFTHTQKQCVFVILYKFFIQNSPSDSSEKTSKKLNCLLHSTIQQQKNIKI